MDQHRHKPCQKQISVLFGCIAEHFLALCKAVVHTHKDAEDRVAGNSGQCAQDTGREAVLYDIQHIFQRRKAERCGDRIDDRIKGVVEFAVLPCADPCHEILAALLDRRNADEGLHQMIGDRVMRNHDADHDAEDQFEDDRRNDACRTETDQRPDHLCRFMLFFVELPDVEQQCRRGQQCNQ